ncbi:MAG: DUF4124 domain-containing protein [Xanthomonadales bacterium]|nr:DUF4124 domain-containing protein [Xanthomonadales bacterium]MBK7147094.1 DUF4124 domain-containing protein [Xanthomonadales bacterium]MCC6562305.1 DUF4124 domain-containing protein [Xanthomonadales bacterium]
MVAVALFLAATAAMAQPRLYRCRQANGQWVFQGQPCAAGEAPSDAERGQPPEITPGGRTAALPAQCETVPLHFPLADPALDGAELTLLLRRDANGYQVVLRLAGVVERDGGPVPVQFSDRLGAQGLRFDDGERIRPDFRRGDREIGWGYARSAALLERAGTSMLVDVEVEPRGYAQSLLSAPLATTALAAARSEMLRCHLLRERVRKASDAERADQVDQAGSDTEAPRP